jgi:hypothetical protein
MAVERGSIQCGAKCDAIVAGNGLNVYFIEQARTHQLTIRRAIQGHSASKSKPAKSGLLSETRTNVKNNSLEALLQCRGNVLVSLPDFFVRATPWNQIGVKK